MVDFIDFTDYEEWAKELKINIKIQKQMGKPKLITIIHSPNLKMKNG